MPRRLLAALLAIAALPALTACGESKEETFGKDFRGVNKRIVALGSEVGKAVNGASKKSDSQLADEFGKLSQRTGELAQDVDELDPPDKLKATTGQLGESLGDAKDALGDIQQAAAKHDATAARRAAIQLASSSRDLRDARQKLVKATR